MAHRAADGAVDRLVGLGLDANADALVVLEHFVDGLDQLSGGPHGALALGAQRALARQPEDDQVRAQFAGDVDGAVGAPHGEFAVGCAGAHEAAVLGARVHPQAGSDELGLEAVLVQQLFHAAGIFLDLFLRHVVHIRHGVVVVELHGGEAQLGEFGKFAFQVDHLAGLGAVGIGAGVDVPGADGKLESGHCVFLLRIDFVVSPISALL